MKNRFAFLLASTMLLALPAHGEDAPAASTPAAAPAQDYTALKVDGEDVKNSEIQDAWKAIFQGRETPPLDSFGPQMKDKFLREVASEHVLYKEAEKENLENTPEVKEMFEKVKRQIVIQQLLKEKTKDAVTDDKLKAAYDAHVKDSSTSASDQDEYHARHILVKTKEEADAIEKKLKNGGDFEKLAKEKSTDKTSGAAGGDLGWFTGDKMVPEFTAAVKKLKKGEVSAPVKSDFGWHVIQLEDTRKVTPPPFAEVKDTLKQEVGNKAVGDYVKGLMKDSKIVAVDASGKETPVPPASAVPDAKDGAPVTAAPAATE